MSNSAMRFGNFVFVADDPQPSLAGDFSDLLRDRAANRARGFSTPADFCLYNMGLHELGIDPADVLPPLKPA